MPPTTQTYGSTNPLLQTKPTTPTISGVNGPGAMQMSSGAQASMTPPTAPTVPRGTTTPTAVASAPAVAPQPTIGETLSGIKAQAATVQQGIDALKASEKKGKLNNPTYDTYPTFDELYKPIDEKAIARNQRKLFQAEIDATNRVYDDMLAQERLAGQGRLGTNAAISARGGLLGSDFGVAQANNVSAANSQAQQAVQNERMAKIGGIMGTMRKAVADEMTEKRAARQQGAENYISYLASARERKENNRNLAARAILDAGLDPATMDPTELDAVGKEAGLSAQEIIMAYKDLQSASAAEGLKTSKTQAEIDKINSDIENAGFFNLSEGQSRYDKDGKVIASKGKTYAPGTGSGGGVPSTIATTVRDRLESMRGSDTYTNTAEYLNEYSSYVEAGGSPEQFLKSFDPDKYVNPNDPSKGWLESQMKKVSQEDPLDALIAGALAEALVPQE
jgi:hypothetical protein